MNDKELIQHLLKASTAIQARIAGIYDEPDLISFGSLTPDTRGDVAIIVHLALEKVRKLGIKQN